LWTHKEAVLKAIGAGLNFGLDRVEFALDRDSEVGAMLHIAAEAGSASEWNLHRIDPAPGLVGALAWRGAARSVRTFTLAS
jgi:4'-phosphopantetheinyl transferase